MSDSLAGFALGLILDAVILKRIFTPVLGVGILHGVALFTVALRKKGRSAAQTEATTPALRAPFSGPPTTSQVVAGAENAFVTGGLARAQPRPPAGPPGGGRPFSEPCWPAIMHWVARGSFQADPFLLARAGMTGYFDGGLSRAQPRPRRSRRRQQRGKGGPALGTLGSTPSGRAQGSVSPAAAT